MKSTHSMNSVLRRLLVLGTLGSGWGALIGVAQITVAQEPKAATAPATDEAGRGSLVEDRAARKLIEAGDARFEAEEYTKAVEIWQSIIERYPRSRVRFDAHMKLGSLLLDRERAYDRARTHFESASEEINSDEEQRAEATLKMGICFYEARNFGKSFKVMRDVIEKFPVSPHVNQAYYYIGLGHFQLGHYSRAIEALEKVGTALSVEEGKVEKVEAGKRLFIKIEDADLAALDVGKSVRIKCTSLQGDEEIVECFAVGRNVRIVLGSIVTSLGRPYKNNGRLEVKGDDYVRVEYVDQHTSDRQFDKERKKEILVVGDGVVEITDGAFSEVLKGVVLDRGVNVQINDPDRDLTDAADKIKAVVEVYREKTQEELDAEAAAAAGKVATTEAPVKPVDAAEVAKLAAEDEARKYKLIDKVEVELTEIKAVRHAVRAPSGKESEADTPGATKAPGATNPTEVSKPDALPAKKGEATETPKAAPKEAAKPAAKTADKADTKTATTKTAPATKGAAEKGATEKKAAGDDKADPKATEKVAGEKKPAPATAKQQFVEPPPPPDDGTIHSGIFRITVPLDAKSEVIAADDKLQAIPGDYIRVTYIDEKSSIEGIRSSITQVRCIEGNLGGVRVTRSQISDQELRIKTQLGTADALTNIGSRYKEFGLQKNANDKYDQALQVCEEISEDAQKLGGRLLEETYVQLWKIYYEMGKLELAAAMSQRLQRDFPNSEFVDDALLKLADVSRKQGDLQRAIGIYSRLVAMDKSQLRGEAQYGIAECYEEMSKTAQGAGATQLADRAFQEYKKVFESFPESGRVGEAVAKMAEHYYKQKDYSRAVDVFETVLNDHPDARFLDVILFNYGRCLYRMERRADARKQFDQLISDYPESPLATDAKRISEALSKAG
ncbi:MAG: Tetratricopeptide domain protein [Planctomycetaceae bacterium]|nr:Tetratricopeptide domain protein [Planctomycetaceae bacterium]